jgi:hypothetical protein
MGRLRDYGSRGADQRPGSSAHEQWWVRFSIRNVDAAADPYVGRLPSEQFRTSDEALDAALAYARELIDRGDLRI